MDDANVSLEHSLSIINGLTREYHTIWLINYKADIIKLFRSDNENRLKSVIDLVNSGGTYDEVFKQYIDHIVAPEFREQISNLVKKDTVIEQLKEHSIYSFEFKRLTTDGDEAWHEMIFACSQNSLDKIEENCVLGIRNIDEKKKYELEIKNANKKVRDQFHVLKSVSLMYNTMHIIDLKKDTFEKYAVSDALAPLFECGSDSAKVIMKHVMLKAIVPEHRKAALEFTDLGTLADRMQGRKYISAEFIGNFAGWIFATFISIDEDNDGRPDRVVFTTQIIDERKQREELLKRESVTDELTGFYNRREYEKDLNMYRENGIEDDFVLMSLDVNRLKFVNDNIGHAAGDELLCGAATTMLVSFGYKSKYYRIGGDEFIIITHTNKKDLKDMQEKFKLSAGRWSGKLVDNLAVSFGTVTADEARDLSMDQITILADKRMYESKAEFYKKMQYDRRVN